MENKLVARALNGGAGCGCHYRGVTGNTREIVVMEQFCLDFFWLPKHDKMT